LVEYALLLAGSSLGTVTTTLAAVISGIDWKALSYALLALVALRIAFWAFDSRS
jgi:hypothetical protein